eukprot:5498644-Amphidinium_carterae.1
MTQTTPPVGSCQRELTIFVNAYGKTLRSANPSTLGSPQSYVMNDLLESTAFKQASLSPQAAALARTDTYPAILSHCLAMSYALTYFIHRRRTDAMWNWSTYLGLGALAMFDLLIHSLLHFPTGAVDRFAGYAPQSLWCLNMTAPQQLTRPQHSKRTAEPNSLTSVTDFKSLPCSGVIWVY